MGAEATGRTNQWAIQKVQANIVPEGKICIVFYTFLTSDETYFDLLNWKLAHQLLGNIHAN